MSSIMYRVSVIIVNFNGLKFLTECISSLQNALQTRLYEIIIVDNGSSDGSIEWLGTRQDVRLIISGSNLGFGAGNNLGAAKAEGDLLLFINNDTRVNGHIEPLLQLAVTPDVGIAACRLQYGDGRLQHSIGLPHYPLRIILSWLGLSKFSLMPDLFRRNEVRLKKYSGQRIGLDWVSGACFAMRREVWREIGGFDPAYFMYCEDVDLCCGLRRLGYQVAFTSECTVTHYEGAGRAWIGQRALHNTIRSYLIYVEKWHGRRAIRWFRPALASVFMLRSLVLRLLALVPGEQRTMYRDKASAFFTCAKLALRG